MSNEVDLLELSKRLEQCAIWLDQKAIGLPHVEATYCKQWATDIRTIVIPEPFDANTQD